MKKAILTQVLEIISELEKPYDFNDAIMNYGDEDDLAACESPVEVREYIEGLNGDNEITDGEVIYYATAINYLKENDPSLRDSLELAHSFGFTTDKINSELLSSLLNTQKNEEDFGEFLDELEEALEDIDLETDDEGQDEEVNMTEYNSRCLRLKELNLEALPTKMMIAEIEELEEEIKAFESENNL